MVKRLPRGAVGRWPRLMAPVMAAVALAAACSGSGQAKAPNAASSPATASRLLPSSGAVSASLSWSAPLLVDSFAGGLSAVSCASASFCAAVGATGPGRVGVAVMWNGRSWSRPVAIHHGEVSHVSCPTAVFCLAGTPDGTALEWDGRSWSQTAERIRWPNPNDGITGVSCASARFCVAPDEDGDMRVWNGASWSVEFKESAHSISCPTSSFCMGVDFNGRAIRWNGRTFTPPQTIDRGEDLAAVSCPSTAFCLALASGDTWLTWDGRRWSAPQRIGTVSPEPPSSNSPINRVSCPTTTLCVAVFSDATEIEWNGTSWTAPQSIDHHLANAVGDAATSRNGHPAIGLQSVSCPTSTFCVAVGTDGRVEMARSTG